MYQPGEPDQQRRQEQRTPQQKSHQIAPGSSTRTPSSSSSPSSFSLSELGTEEYDLASVSDTSGSMMATTMDLAARRSSIASNASYYHSPSPQPWFYAPAPSTQHHSGYTPPYFYYNTSGTASHYAQLPRPRAASRTRSYGYSVSRSHSRSISPSPHSSPAVRQTSLNAVAAGASPPLGFQSGNLSSLSSSPYVYQHQQQQQTIVTPAGSGSFPTRSPVPFPSQLLPPHPAIAALRTPSRPGWAERLTPRTVECIVAPYRRGDAGHSAAALAAAWGALGVFPQTLLNKIWSHLGYKDLIFLREVSRAARDTVDPQRANQEDKYMFVREREDKLDEKARRQGAQMGRLGSAQQCRAPSQAACYFCYKVKPTTEFQGPTEQRHWVTVHHDPVTGKVQYTPIPEPDADDKAPGAAPSSRRPSYTSQTEGNYNQQFGTYSQQPQAQPRLCVGPGRSTTPVEDTKIHLRQYCIECGVEYGLHVPGELYKTWASEGARGDGKERSKWICNCTHLPPRDRIHDLFVTDFCKRCNRRGSYR